MSNTVHFANQIGSPRNKAQQNHRKKCYYSIQGINYGYLSLGSGHLILGEGGGGR